MKRKLRRWWHQLHSKRIVKIKLKFISWWHSKQPGKYCWTDCVSWAYACDRFNPFNIDNSLPCKQESVDHECGMCYCGGWMKGECYDLMSREKKIEYQRQLNDNHEQFKNELPF